MKQNISVRLDKELLDRIEKYAASRNIKRTQAIIYMLESTQIIQLNEGAEIVRLLHSVECALQKKNLNCRDFDKIEGCCEELWRLLNLITGKIQP